MPRLIPFPLLVLLAIGACAARQVPVHMSSTDQSQAMHMYCDGASIKEVATQFSLETADARALIHEQLVELNKRYYGNSSRR